jgi:hypothetical protein
MKDFIQFIRDMKDFVQGIPKNANILPSISPRIITSDEILFTIDELYPTDSQVNGLI